MYRDTDLRLSLTFLISLFLHIVFIVALISPHLSKMLTEKSMSRDSGISRDIIVNINQDNKRIITRETLLSDKDSSAKGFLTRTKGNRWLNNSRDFRLTRGKGGKSRGRRVQKVRVKVAKKQTILLSQKSEVVAFLESKKPIPYESIEKGGPIEKILVPDKNDITMKNSIFYSSDGRFSFNTAKFKDFEYFKRMKDKIASNWYPPIMANATMYGVNPLTGGYTPGRTRIMAIPSQVVKLYFILDRSGKVKQVRKVSSMGNRALDNSCVQAITLSKTFGPVPSDLKGKEVVIPFIFGFYAY